MERKPMTIELEDGKMYRATVMRVVTSDAKGPRTFEIVRDDERVTVEEGMQFWIVYASDDVLNARVM